MTITRRALIGSVPVAAAAVALRAPPVPAAAARPPTGTVFGASRAFAVPGYASVPVSRVYLTPGQIPTNYLNHSLLRQSVEVSTEGVWLSGKDPRPDRWLGPLLDSLEPTGLTIYYTQHHEPETDYSDISAYHREWTRAAPIVNSRSWCQLGPCLTGWHADGISEDYWPRVPVDFCGFDKYNPGIGSPARYQNPVVTFERIVAFASRVDRPLMVGETGTGRVSGDTSGAGQRKWTRDAHTALVNYGCTIALWWNSQGVAFTSEAHADDWLQG